MPKHPAKPAPKHSKTKNQKRKQVAPEDKPLTAFQRKCVEKFKGNKTQAVIDAGSKSKTPDRVASKLFSLPNVQAALKKKEDAFVANLGEREAEGVTITRNDIINRLDALSTSAETDSAKVAALRELKDIFGMSSRNSSHDLFAGWTDEELETYHRTGALPARFAAPDDET
jgi:hypothetical protein